MTKDFYSHLCKYNSENNTTVELRVPGTNGFTVHSSGRLKQKEMLLKKRKGGEDEPSGPLSKKQKKQQKKKELERMVGGKAGKGKMKMKSLRCRDQDEEGKFRGEQLMEIYINTI